MALPSTPESVNLSIALTEHYFHMIFLKYGISFPEDASWKELDKSPSLNGHARVFQNILKVVFEIADLFEDARVEKLVTKCERLGLNNNNLYNQLHKDHQYVLLDGGITWGKVVMFFSFAVSFAIHLCNNEMSHLAGRVSMYGQHKTIQNRIQPWIDVNGGWVSNDIPTLYARIHASRHVVRSYMLQLISCTL